MKAKKSSNTGLFLSTDLLFNQVFYNSLDGVILTDEDNRIIAVNPAWEAITGYRSEEVVGRNPNVIRSGATQPETFIDMWRSLSSQGKWMGEIINRCKDGRPWYSYLSITRLQGPEGRTTGYIGIVRDISLLRAKELELADRLREIEAHQEVTIHMMAKMSEESDPTIDLHLKRISVLVRYITKQLDSEGYLPQNLAAPIVESIPNLCVLHDVGKIGIPAEILLKPARLGPEEFAVMKLHTLIGARILGEGHERLQSLLGVDETFLAVARDIACYHHERWDGKGYPEGLKGDEIPLPARITAVADVFDALISKRVYKEPVPSREASNYIREMTGSQFDPLVAEAFLSALSSIPEETLS